MAESAGGKTSLMQVHLARFGIKGGKPSKIHTKWRIERVIKAGGEVYELSAVVLHTGQQVESGHYLAVVGGHKYDDGVVTAVKDSEIELGDVYLLMYARRSIKT